MVGVTDLGLFLSKLFLSKVQHHIYSAFGELVNTVDANNIVITGIEILAPFFTYTNREYDEESGHYHYRARTYDASIGRFLQVDPDSGVLFRPITFLSFYTYAVNSPTSYVDPTGRFIESLFYYAIDKLDRLYGKLFDKIGIKSGSERSDGYSFLSYNPNFNRWTDSDKSDSESGGGDKTPKEVEKDEPGLETSTPIINVIGAYSLQRFLGYTVGEFWIGSNFRAAPFGNSHSPKPHYHRRVIDPNTGRVRPGGSIKKHRPWEGGF